MSVERIERNAGSVVWRVRWRDEAGRNRSKVLGRKRDAEAFDAEVRRMKRTRELGRLDAGKETLAEFGKEWWKLHAEPNLARSTRIGYAIAWDRHILPRVGQVPLRELSPRMLQGLRADLEADGVGPAAIRKAMVILHGVLARAVEWELLTSNPAAAVRSPVPKRRRVLSPLTPANVEAMRAYLISIGKLGDATLISVLAYAGLRPGEALALSWEHARERTLLVEGAVSLGEIKETKTGRTRSVAICSPLKRDLAEWRLACGRPDPAALIFPGHDGRPWSVTAWKNWRHRTYIPAARSAGVSSTRPYDLRHSFVSLLIHEGRSVVEIARQAGHAPTMTLNTYGHVFDEFTLEDRLPAEDQIRKARGEDVPVLYLSGGPPADGSHEIPANLRSRRPDSNRGPLHYECFRSVYDSHPESCWNGSFPLVSGAFQVDLATSAGTPQNALSPTNVGGNVGGFDMCPAPAGPDRDPAKRSRGVKAAHRRRRRSAPPARPLRRGERSYRTPPRGA